MNQSLTDDEREALYGSAFDLFPTHPCANCGGPCSGTSAVCSEKCDGEFVASLAAESDSGSAS
jgi:hypothetical protein